MRRDFLIFALLAVATAMFLSPVLLFPLNNDNDTYQAMAFAMIEGRGVPYVGSWDQNFPGIVFYHWVGIKLFGLSDVAFRCIDLINRVAIALLLYRLSARFVGTRAALFAIPIVCLVYLNSGMSNAGQRDGFALTWLVIALLQATKPRLEKAELACFGLAIAAATFIRPTNVLFGLILLPAIIQKRMPTRQIRVAVLSFTSTVLICLIPWLLTTGGLVEFYTATIRFNLEVYGVVGSNLQEFYESLYLNRYFHLLSLGGLLLICLHKEIGKYSPVLIQGLIGFCLILAMGKYYLYHFEHVIPLTVILSIAAIDRALGSITLIRWMPVGILIYLCFKFYPAWIVKEFINRGGDAEAVTQIRHGIVQLEPFSFANEEAVMHYLDEGQLTTQSEFLLLCPSMRWRSGHPGISRFTTTFLMTMGSGSESYQMQWRAELDSVLTSSRPKAIVAATGPHTVFRLSNYSPDSLIRSLPKTSRLLRTDYALDTVIGGFNIYRLNEAAN